MIKKPLLIWFWQFLDAILLHEVNSLVDVVQIVCTFVGFYVVVYWNSLEDLQRKAVVVVDMEKTNLVLEFEWSNG
jgi:ABC-type metal ion transport system substrate-binding protein